MSTVVTAYLVGKNAIFAKGMGSEELGALVCRQINDLGIGPVHKENMVFTDTITWPEVGPIISANVYEDFFNGCLRPAKRVLLAGDYTWWSDTCMPYGMTAAIESGRRAAKMILTDSTCLTLSDFSPEPLFRTSVTHLSQRGPVVQEYIEDGNIAFYGLVLQAHADKRLEQYLVDAAEDGLWAFHRHYGVTSLDSALVMEGLLSTGRHRHLLERGALRLVEQFFDQNEGGFGTLPCDRQGRASYWEGTDCLATAHCAWLLRQIAPSRYPHVIGDCAAYLRRKQLLCGNWPGKWFASQILPTYLAVRFLRQESEETRTGLDTARLWLLGHQNCHGSWSGSVMETAAAVLALEDLRECNEAVDRGRQWLLDQNALKGQPGEPVLVYWFHDAGRKTLYHTHDKGRVSAAWATLALKNASGTVAQ